MGYFNSLKVDLDNDAYFSPEISERTKENPNRYLASLCSPCNDSLDEYAENLANEVITALTD